MSMVCIKRQLNKCKNRKQSRRLWYRERQLVTCIENFANELFYEIFEYLDGCEIYQSFSNLNIRFQHILSSSALQLKITLSPFLDIDIQHDYIKIISQQKNQILSLRLMYTLMTFDSSFIRLESLIIIGLNSNDLLQHLSGLILLPRLRSLIISISYNLKDFCDMYRLIFNLPVLKYIKFSSEVYEPMIPLSIAANDQFSSIEYLMMNHSCYLKDLISILSYTPRLSRLTCRELIRLTENITQETTIHLSNLIYISIKECYAIFDILESFLKKIVCPLEVLRVHTYWDANYLDADRWQRLFVEYMPYLNEFCLQYHEFIDDDFQITEVHRLINRFLSSFWITQHYIFELAIDVNDWSWSEIIYSIHPYKRKWNERMSSDTDFIGHNSQDIILTITAPFRRELNELFTNNVINLFTLLPVTQLNISHHGFSMSTLICLLYHLPNLNTLRVLSLSLQRTLCVSEAPTTHCVLSKTNQITKINIRSLTELSQLQVLLDLCPNVQHLQIDDLDNIDLKLCLRFILTKKSNHIILCLHIPTANDMIIKELQDMINSEKLYHDCIIKRSYNKIYLQCGNNTNFNY